MTNHIGLILFDNEIETIRSFNPEDQRTIEKDRSECELLPAHEFPLNKVGIEKFRENYSTRIGGDLASVVKSMTM